MRTGKRTAGRDQPFAEALARGTGEPGRRQAQRLTHRLLRRARARGHTDLADWLGDGFREGRMTVEGAAGDPARLALTLAAVRVCDFVEAADATGRASYGSATLSFDCIDPRGMAVAPIVVMPDLLGAEAGELHGTLLAAAFGVSDDAHWHRLRYLGIDELLPDPQADDHSASLDVWDVLSPAARSPRLPASDSVYRVRFAWADQDRNIHLARLEQPMRGVGEGRRPTRRPTRRRARADATRLVLKGPPVLRSVSDSRLAADRWDRLLLDSFVANQIVGDLTGWAAERA